VVLVASALARGAPSLIADSSGNAGSAIAAYAARAGLACRVFVPKGTSAAKQAQISAYGATLELVPGDRTATAQRAWAAVGEHGATYASHVYDPYFLQGTKTFAFEIWEQLGATPEAIVIPAGNGTLLLGAWIGFSELRAAGLIARVPALVAVQSERCAPLAAAFAQGADEPLSVAARPTVAEGIAIPRPARGAEMLAAIRASGGAAVAVPEAAIAPARADLAARGLLVEPTAAAAWAALGIARGLPALAPWAAVESEPWTRARSALGATVVVPLCGSGLKSPSA
jgi:threonine synthase